MLLSPACASFDQYRNFEVRGDAFRTLPEVIARIRPLDGRVRLRGTSRLGTSLPMAKAPLEKIDPLQIFMHALGFHVAEDALGSLTLGPNQQFAAQVVQPTMALSAFTTELFLKCLICIETTLTPQGHHLFELFKQLEPATQGKLIHLWNTHVVPIRDPEWKIIESHQYGGNQRLKRDLPGALSASSKAFEKIRYSYEPGSNADFNIGDMPRILRHVILERKPEWASVGRDIKTLADTSLDQK